jgi:hypothetical protein
MAAVFPERLRTGAVSSTIRGLVLACALGLAGPLAAAGQSAPPPAGPVQYVTRAQFDAMVQAGTLVPVTHRTLAESERERRKQQRSDRDVVEDYLRLHPELTTLKAIVNAGRDGDDDGDRDGGPGRSSADGLPLSFVNVNGQRQTEVLLGKASQLGMLANSIRQLSLPAAQLQLYTTFYNQLPAALCQPSDNGIAGVGGACAGLPTPASLRDAPLGAIRQAVGALAALTRQVVALLPPPAPGNEPVACRDDVGNNNSPAAGQLWGDQTITTGCPAPSAAGIYANFSFPNQGLISCIKNQGDRGTCHIFAATSAMEELVARDTGTFVNLNEQDFQEHVKLDWENNSPDLFHDSGSSFGDLNAAAAHNYSFAYENQWDYNPSLSEPVNTYVNTCVGYPATEAGCSDTAPQAPEVCVAGPAGFFQAQVCGFVAAPLPGARSPYRAASVSNVWNAANPQLTFDYMILGLALNNAVLLGFNVTQEFQGAPGGYVPYDAADLSTSIGGHEVHVIGYVSNQDLAGVLPQAPPGAGGGYFIIKNSWGACLGDGGYYYLPVAYLLKEANEVDIVSTEVH